LTKIPSLFGACSCGAVKFQAAADMRRLVNCHCNMCRKINGSAFSTYAVIPYKALFVSGEESVAEYQVTDGARKHFCKKCGTPLFNINVKYPGVCMLYLGSLEESPTPAPSVNVFCESMLGWVEHVGEMTRIEQGA
jgi:hypothetical protein